MEKKMVKMNGKDPESSFSQTRVYDVKYSNTSSNGAKAQTPKTGHILSLIGGILVLLVGGDRLMELIRFGSYPGGTGLDGALDLGFGLICGLIIIVGSIMLFRRPQQHRMWGVIVLIFSLLSLVGTAGGAIIGLLLGSIGGILGITWKPSIARVTNG